MVQIFYMHQLPFFAGKWRLASLVGVRRMKAALLNYDFWITTGSFPATSCLKARL